MTVWLAAIWVPCGWHQSLNFRSMLRVFELPAKRSLQKLAGATFQVLEMPESRNHRGWVTWGIPSFLTENQQER